MGQSVELAAASQNQLKPKSQLNKESPFGAVLAAVVVAAVVGVFWSWPLGVALGVILFAIGMKARSDAIREWRRMAESPAGSIWVREYKDAKAYQHNGDLMGAFGWELRQQSQGGSGGGAIGGLAVGPVFLGGFGTNKGKILVTWIRGEPKIRCRSCDEPISPAATICPHCGRQVTVIGVPSGATLNARAPASLRAGRRVWRRGDELELEHSVDLRRSADPGDRPFAAIASGSLTTVLDVDGEWLFIQTEDGTEGWARL